MIRNISIKDMVIVLLLAGVIALFFYGLGSALIPLIFAWLLAYAAIPLVKKIEKKGLNRLQASIAVLTLVFVALISLVLLIVPPLFSELIAAIIEMPRNVSVSLEKLDTFFSNYGYHVPYNKQMLIEFTSQYSEKISSDLVRSVGQFLSNSFVNAASVIVIALNVFLVPFFFVYVINDYEQLMTSIESLVPLSWHPPFEQFIRESDQILSGYIRGQLLVCAVLSVLYTAALLIVGVKFAVIIGIFTGILSIIPYVGFSIGLTAAFMTALADFDGLSPLIGVLISYSIVQLLESFIITPRIVGGSVGLSSFEAIIALIVFGNLLGFIGLFLAIPVGAITKLLIRNLLHEYKNTSFYKVH